MSFEEKSVWIQLIAMLSVLGGYFFVASAMLDSNVHILMPYVITFMGASALMVLVLILGHVAAAITRRPEPADERDRLIGWKAEARSSWVLGAGIIIAVGWMTFAIDRTTGLPDPRSLILIAHVLLASMVLSHVLKFMLQIIAFRRGA